MESADTPIPFVIYGTVFDYYTGEPVRGAEVSLHTGSNPSSPVGSSQSEGSLGSAVTGYDGQYEMHCIITENIDNSVHHHYSLFIAAYGYSDYCKSVTLEASKELKDSRIQIDVSMH